MRELSNTEISQVSGGGLLDMQVPFLGFGSGLTLRQRLLGGINGWIDDGNTGAQIGNKFATSGQWGFGLLSQAFGTALSRLGGQITGGLGGLALGTDGVENIIRSYRNSVVAQNSDNINYH